MSLYTIRITIVAIFFSLVSTAHAFTYWTDGSCTGKIDDIIPEVLEMAQLATDRLNNKIDNFPLSPFNILWKKPVTDAPTFNEVHRICDGIHQWTATASRTASDVRIYCDDDARWTIVPDIPGAANPNSHRRRGVDQEWEDTINHIRMPLRTQGCGDANTLAETYTMLPAAVPPGENPQRQSITICDISLINVTYKTLDDIKKQKDLSQLKTLDAFESLASTTLLHEWTHLRQYDRDDVGNNAYGWVPMQNLNAAESLLNADGYAYYGLLAKLAQRRFRLSLKAAEARAGKLVYAK